MKRMNVEQLDDAFRLSLVDASTLVWKVGMKTWQRLGAVAGIDDEPANPFASSKHAPPPPPPPRPAPRTVAHHRAQAQAPYHTPSHAPMAYAQTFAPTPHARPAQAPVARGYTQPLVAPVFTPAPRSTRAPDPYVLPQRRVAIPSEVDFRRRSGGVRWGRWLVALLLITGGVLGAYRQNLLREGARRIGFEQRYLANEQRATAFVTAKAPPAVKSVLTRLKLLPGPNALPAPVAALTAVRPAAPVTSPAAPTPATDAAAAAPSVPSSKEAEVKTVSLDSLPVLTAEAQAQATHAASTPVAAAAPVAAGAPPVRSKPVARANVELNEAPARTVKKAEKAEKPAPVAKAEKPKPEPKHKAEPPPPANESFLNAAIRSSIANDKKK